MNPLLHGIKMVYSYYKRNFVRMSRNALATLIGFRFVELVFDWEGVAEYAHCHYGNVLYCNSIVFHTISYLASQRKWICIKILFKLSSISATLKRVNQDFSTTYPVCQILQ